MEKAVARGRGANMDAELGGEFPVQDLVTNQGGLLQVCMEGIGLLFANSKVMCLYLDIFFRFNFFDYYLIDFIIILHTITFFPSIPLTNLRDPLLLIFVMLTI